MFVFLFSQLVGTGFYVAKDIFFIWLARKRVYADLRETAARAVMPIRATHLAVSAPPVPTAQNAPPVIRDK